MTFNCLASSKKDIEVNTIEGYAKIFNSEHWF